SDLVGVGYLTLDRSTRTLSGGEIQRVNLTTCLGASLVNTLFVMDEPSIGLHPRDLGPGRGERGGELVWNGSLNDFLGSAGASPAVSRASRDTGIFFGGAPKTA